MVKRRHVVRPAAKPAATKAVRQPVEDAEDFEDLDETVVDDEDDDNDEDDVVVDDEDEEEEEAPAPVRKAKKVVAVEADEEDPEPPKKVKKAAPAADEAPKKGAEIRTVEATVVENVFTELIEALEDGNAIFITKTGKNKYQVTSGAAVVSGSSKRMARGEYLDEVINPEYKEWKEKWRGLSFEAKKKYAKKLGVEWDAHEDEGIETMRLTQTVRLAEGIEKYKPEYRDRASRSALRSGG